MREIFKSGRGTFSDDQVWALLDGRSVKELQEVAAEIGTTAHGVRTRPKLIAHIVSMAVAAARKHQGLRHW